MTFLFLTFRGEEWLASSGQRSRILLSVLCYSVQLLTIAQCASSEEGDKH